MTLRCDRGGSYKNTLGLTEGRLIDCPFELYADRHNDLWYLEVRNSNHNHDCSEGHPIARNLSESQLKTVAGSRKNKKSPFLP